MVDALAGGATTITWWVADNPGTTPMQLYGTDGNAITTAIVSGRAYVLPDGLFGAHQIVPVLNAGTASVRFTGKC